MTDPLDKIASAINRWVQPVVDRMHRSILLGNTATARYVDGSIEVVDGSIVVVMPVPTPVPIVARLALLEM